MLLNRRFDAKGPVGTYSGNMTANFNGGKITALSTETSAMRSGAMSMCYLAGNMTVNFNGTDLCGNVFYAITRTATLNGVNYDSANNTGSLTVNAPASLLDGTIVANQRTNTSDAQYAGIDSFTLKCNNLAGDIDEDGTVTNADVSLAVRYLSGFSVKGAKFSCDVNGDGKINNRDAIEIVLKLA
jgi:fluoride ion exporter CrcB/FEX